MEFQSLQAKISYLAAKTPDKIALEQGNRRVTYLEVEESANQLANFLHTKIGNTPNIAVMMENSIELVEVLLGIFKVGGIFIPLDPGFPENRLKLMLDKVDAEWIITSSAWLEKLDRILIGESKQINVLVLDSTIISDQYKNINIFKLDNNLAKDYQVENVNKHCYIYFTSGSTGTPKAILGRHRSLKHFIEWEISELGVNENFRVSQLITPSFDPFLRDVFVPLYAGATLCIPESRELLLSPDKLKEWLDQSQVTLVHMVPTLFRSVMEVIEDAKCLANLQYILLAGELLRGQDVKKFFTVFGDRIELLNLYGATETTLIKLFYRVKPEDMLRHLIPVGKPISGAQVMILNKHMQKCPHGSIGEVYIRTPYITSGYYKERELTQKVFIPNPFSNNPQDIIYQTGDLGRMLQNGDVEIIGREDHQVKVRGVRIEPGEVENQILRFEKVKEVVVIAREDNTNTKYLCAYIVSDEHVEISELREYLLKQVPDYMVPSYFVQLDKLPHTPTGKIDRKALPEPISVHTGVEYVAPENALEEKLIHIWSELMGTEGIGVQHDFFELGGHSLKAGQLLGKIRQEFDVEVPLKVIFEHSTIQKLAKYIEKAESNQYSVIRPVEEREYYPVSSAQKRMYLMNQLGGDETNYNIPKAIFVEGEIDYLKLEKALQALIQRHETLRTSFDVINEEIVQIVHQEVDFAVTYLNAKEDELAKINRQFIQPFDLSKAPLFRVTLVRIASERHVLLFDMHHIISDGSSGAVVFKEFVSLYEGVELPELSVQYKDFAVWQKELFATELMKQMETYWLSVFTGNIPVLNLPLDFPRPVAQSFAGSNINFALDQELTHQIEKLTKETGATTYMVLLAAYNVLLAKYTGEEDIIVGSPTAGRVQSELQGLIGMFINTLPMRNYPKANKTFKEFLYEVKENALKAFDNQEYPFELLTERLGIERDTSRNVLFDTMFVLQNMDVKEYEIAGLRFTPYEYEIDVAKFDLQLTAYEVEDRILFTLNYCSQLFTQETMEKFSKHFIFILQQVLHDPELSLQAITLFSEEERKQLLGNRQSSLKKPKKIEADFDF